MTVPTFVAATNTDTGTGTGNLTINHPANTAADDLILMFFFTDNNTNTVDVVGSGFSLVFGPQNGGGGTPDERMYCYQKILTGAEASSTWSQSEARNSTFTACRITGANTSTPIDDSDGVGRAAGTSHAVPPNVTTTVADCLVVGGITFDASAVVPPQWTVPSSHGGWTEDVDTENATSNQAYGVGHVGIADASTNITGSWTSATSDATAQILVAIAPAAGEAATKPQPRRKALAAMKRRVI